MRKSYLKLMILLVLTSVLQSKLYAQDYNLKISKIDMKKTPQSGDWRAGARVSQESEKDNQDSWHGGESKFDGPDASIPVNLELSGLHSGELISLFIGSDDDAEDAGNESKSEDKLYVKFKVFGSGGKEKLYSYSTGDWSILIHYSLSK